MVLPLFYIIKLILVVSKHTITNLVQSSKSGVNCFLKPTQQLMLPTLMVLVLTCHTHTHIGISTEKEREKRNRKQSQCGTFTNSVVSKTSSTCMIFCNTNLYAG